MAQRATERIEVRVRPEVAAQIREAAQASHMTVTAFLVSAALERAEEVFADKVVWVVSDREFDQMVTELDEPATPNENLVAALRQAHQLIDHR